MSEQPEKPTKASLNPWKWPEEPWVRLHTDYAGPFMGHMYLIIIDAHSKWLEILPATKVTAQGTVKKMREMCLPPMDCRIRFSQAHVSLVQFMEQNSIQHIGITSYHPSLNGLAEWAVQSFKNAMKKLSATPANVETKILQFLFRYCVTLHTTMEINCPCRVADAPMSQITS